MIWKKCKAIEKRISYILEKTEAQLYNAPTHKKTQPTPLQIVQSFPEMGLLSVACLVSQYPEILSGADAKALCTFSGGVPVTQQSGGMKVVCMRRSRNLKQQNMFTHLALNNLRDDCDFKRRYRRQRERGKKHYHALRLMARPMINTLCAMLRDGTLYKEKKCPI